MISFEKIKQYRKEEDVARFIKSRFLYDKLQKEKPIISLNFQIYRYKFLITDLSILKLLLFISLVSTLFMILSTDIVDVLNFTIFNHNINDDISKIGYCITFSILFVLNIIFSSIILYLLYLVVKIINFIVMLIDAIIFNVSNHNNK